MLIKRECLEIFSGYCRRYITPGVIIPVFLFLLLSGFVLFNLVIPPIADHFSLYSAPDGVVDKDPSKTKSSKQPFVFRGNYGFWPSGNVYVITPLFDYSIEARVLHIRRYYSPKNTADLIPFDIGLGWRAMSNTKELRRYFVFHHKTAWGRYLHIKPKGDWQKIPELYLEEVETGVHYSNNHIIPADENVFETIKDLSAGDIVKMEGMLVNVSRPDLPQWQWKTSQHEREDKNKYNKWGSGFTSDHQTTCDTFFVKKVVRLTP